MHRVNGSVDALERITQLRVAKNAGLSIPRTVMTRDLDQIARAESGWDDDVVVKPLGSHWVEYPIGAWQSAFPFAIDRRSLISEPAEVTPVLVQDYIPHTHELRVFVVGDAIIVYSVHQRESAASLWEHDEVLEIRATELTDETEEKVRRYIRLSGTEIGAMDLLVTASGLVVFMEMNNVCDWRFFQSKANDTRVTDAVANYLESRVVHDIVDI